MPTTDWEGAGEEARRRGETEAERAELARQEAERAEASRRHHTMTDPRYRTPEGYRASEQFARDEGRRSVMDRDPTYTPDYRYEGLVDGGASQFGTTFADPSSIEAQRRALDMMREQAETRGFTPAEQAMMQANIRGAEQSARGQRMADMQALESRGMGGSGMAMLSGQMAADSAADRAADVGAQGMMSAQQRALTAMESYGGQAAQMRGQSFGENATRASGMDAWNQALAQRAQGVEGRNAERYNQGQDQGFQNRFQREALSQGLYGMERGLDQAERDRRAAEHEANRDREQRLQAAGIQAGATLVGTAIGSAAGA